MSAAVDKSNMHTCTGTRDSVQQRNREERLDENDCPDSRTGDSLGSMKGSDVPRNSSLHRVADMLKEKITSRSSIRDEDNNTQQESANSRETFRPFGEVGLPPYLSPIMPASGKSLSHSPNGCDTSVQDFALAMSRHHMNMVMTNEAMMPDSAKVLRGILQGKESAVDGRTDSSVITKLLQHDRDQLDNSFSRNGEFDVNDSDGESFPQSGSPGDLSSEDSDQENNMNGANGSDDMQSEGKKRKTMMDMSEENSIDGSEVSGDESSNLKRARVETIINKMNISPDQPEGSSEVRKASKRKQYIPQQHGTLESSSPKARKVEKGMLQKQLKQMQEQLAVMQKKYTELFDQDGSEQSELSDVADNVGPKKPSKDEKSTDSPRKLLDNNDMDPRMFIKQANELVREQAKLAALTKKQVSPTRGDTPSDLNGLARLLKDEITHSVGSLVDTVVSKFVECQKKKELSKASLSGSENSNKGKPNESGPVKPPSPAAPSERNTPKPPRTKVTDKVPHLLFDNHPRGMFLDIPRAHVPLFPPPPYFPHTQVPTMQPLYAKEPEQTEALPLVVNTPKKKRTKVTDTRLSPRAARALLQESLQHHNSSHAGHGGHLKGMHHHLSPHTPEPFHPHHHVSALVPTSLPTSVAIPNPGLQHSEVLAMYSSGDHHMYPDMPRGSHHSPSTSPNMAHTPSEGLNMSMVKAESEHGFDYSMGDASYDGPHAITSTLTPMHLRKAKLMFFYCRYPSSSILKIYFPDVKFNKNNTAQLVKWFSNFREFYYIQMEKYSRQALAEGVKNAEDLIVTTDSELYRVLNLHYNRNNQVEVPDNFRLVVQSTLREFFKAIQAGKDQEQSWKKAIYKIIARMDDALPEFFKLPNWMEQLNDA